MEKVGETLTYTDTCKYQKRLNTDSKKKDADDDDDDWSCWHGNETPVKEKQVVGEFIFFVKRSSYETVCYFFLFSVFFFLQTVL